MKVVAILQARVSSSRLPNKVLLPILGLPMLQHQVERVLQSKAIDKLVIATSDHKSDDAIEKLANEMNVSCFRGCLNDVLDRFYNASLEYPSEHIVRLTGDCPLIDAAVIDQVIEYHLDSESDYTSNVSPPTFPDGLDVEVIKASVIYEAWSNARLLSEREHVTPYIRKQTQDYRISNYQNTSDLSVHRWTVDEAEDFEFVTEVYRHLYPVNKAFKMEDVLLLLENIPNIYEANQKYTRNEGYAKSLLQDKDY